MLRRILPPFLFQTTYSLPLRVSGLLTFLLPWLLLMGNAPADIAVTLVGLLFLLDSSLTKNWRWTRQPWLYALAVLLLYMFVRSIFTLHPSDAIFRTLTFIRYPLFAVALSAWVWQIPAINRLLFFSLATSISFLFFDCFFQYALGYDVTGRSVFYTDTASVRLTGPFSAPKVGIHLVWLTFPVLAMLVSFSARSLRVRDNMTGSLFVVLFLTVMFITGERMAFLLMLFGCALFFLAYPPLRKPFIVMVLFGLFAVSMLAQYNPSLVTRQYFSTVKTVEKADRSAYGQIWSSARAMWEAYPVFGVGPKHFRYYCPEARFGDTAAEPDRCNLHPHQLYLEWAVETGTVGLVLFLFMIGLMVSPVLKRYPTLKTHPLYIGLLIALIIRLWPLSTGISFFANWAAIPFWLVTGWLLAVTHTQHSLRRKVI